MEESTDLEITNFIRQAFDSNCNLFAIFYNFNNQIQCYINGTQRIYINANRRRFLQLLVEYLELIPNISYSTMTSSEGGKEKIVVSITYYTNAMLQLK